LVVKRIDDRTVTKLLLSPILWIEIWREGEREREETGTIWLVLLIAKRLLQWGPQKWRMIYSYTL